MPPEEPSEAFVDEALRFLRAHKRGTLQFDENYLDWEWVIDGGDGRLVGPVMVATLLASQHVLHIPEETDDPGAMRVLLSVEPIEADDTAIGDRWRAYHGEPEDVRWGAFWIDFAKWREQVVDGDALMAANPLLGDEAALLKTLNADKARLSALCDEVGGMRGVEAPVAVGVDPDGVDVRARFDVVRLAFEDRAEDAAAARAAVERWTAAG